MIFYHLFFIHYSLLAPPEGVTEPPIHVLEKAIYIYIYIYIYMRVVVTSCSVFVAWHHFSLCFHYPVIPIPTPHSTIFIVFLFLLLDLLCPSIWVYECSLRICLCPFRVYLWLGIVR
ncbi:hypothetical protein, unlikely [Trypanosoma brucei gambiense DAL972]|uniref:Uncharacterized protein n=1 Tax=Trypanosoma brucei gambiense (strain MHOM/CI/86/DAL972) TaxID=679716 RepID=C9ZPW0_TRYB9|nr:hypothetical protein, unlikely [Trypanosoma brucei gambiense DAL972]CBH11438.1 hypothetical protein, unlikely [Trypanosoma brucei gambiense DAL972]|eukprot:XP_011773725.1 hypothetical protein, unlikely [Trypanosoma brucei gambiense DAL972]